MFEIVIQEKGGSSRTESFEKAEITIGRVQGNDVILPKGNISKRHSRIVLKDGKFIIVDLKSTNGTYVNGKKISGPQVIKSTDKIYIGDFTLQLSSGNGVAASVDAPREAAPKAVKDDELDLFGGEDKALPPESPARPAALKTPGLIDDNFDQEFEGKEPAARLPEPVRLPEPSRPRGRPEVEQKPIAAARAAPEPLDLEEDEGFGEPDEGREIELEEPPSPPPAPVKLPRSPPKAASRVRPTPIKKRPGADASPLFEEDEHEEAPPRALEPRPGPELASVPAAERIASAHEPHAPAVTKAPSPGWAQPPGALLEMSRAGAVSSVRAAVIEELDLASVGLAALGSFREEAAQAAERAVRPLVSSGRIVAEDARSIAEEAAFQAVDLGVVAPLLDDDSVVEVAITTDRQVWADREGHLESTGVSADSEKEVMRIISTLGALAGQDVHGGRPLVDVRLRDGSRVVASVPPLAFRGPTLTIRKTSRDAFTLEKLFEYSTISRAMLVFLTYCVRYRKGVLLSVGPGVNPTATLNALAVQMPEDDRIVTIESGVELHLQPLKNVTSFEPNGGADLGALVRHAVTMQADRAIIAGLGGPFTSDVLRAMAGPLEGSVTCYPARSPNEALERIVRFELPSSLPDGPQTAMRLLSLACPVVLQERRFQDNSRRITSVGEVVLAGDAQLGVEEIFRFVPEGVDEQGIVTGSFISTGYQPRFLEELVDRGEAADVDMSIFKA